jgi:hypothetical protein
MADDEIPLIPTVPEALREAQQLGKLIPFVGAGVSCLAGCPDWTSFANGALRYFVSGGKFSHGQLEQIKGLNPRIKLSLALSLQEEHRLKIDFGSLLHPVPRKDNAAGCRVYASLSKIGKTFVTTNYDQWLDDELSMPIPSVTGLAAPSTEPLETPRLVFHRSEDLTAVNLNTSGTVLHLHGSMKRPEGMVITTRDYVRHYANDRWSASEGGENPVLTFLEHLFSKKTVLFIGYGLDELEILEYVILKTRDFMVAGLQPRHFILQGFFSHERELMLGMRRYFRECGIELLCFLKDHKGWDQLVDVLDEFARSIPASDLAVLQELNEMETLIDG